MTRDMALLTILHFQEINEAQHLEKFSSCFTDLYKHTSGKNTCPLKDTKINKCVRDVFRSLNLKKISSQGSHTWKIDENLWRGGELKRSEGCVGVLKGNWPDGLAGRFERI